VFIKYADNPRYKGVIEELVKARKEIAMANEVLTHISKDDHERAKFRSRQKFIADMEHNLLVSRDEGIAIGKTEGIAIGKTEGKTEGIALGRLEAARAMLKKGYSIQDIIDITQLSFEEINNLRNFK
jgi:predicted transposase/invertase (TIGR01784 family)